MQNKLQSIVNCTKQALEVLFLKNTFDEENSTFTFKVKLENEVYAIEIMCTDQYLCAITELPVSNFGDNIYKILSDLNQEHAIGYLILNDQNRVTCRVALGLRDTEPSVALVREAILRSLQVASSSLPKVKQIIEAS